jgi:hypothetical protein
MAIKGKSRSRSGRRGSPRRPPGAPRVVGPPRRRVPWWRTRTARIWFAVAAVVVLLIVLWIVRNARDDAEALERRQDAIQDFTSQVSTAQQAVAPSASEMFVSTADTPNLAAEAERWRKALNASFGDFSEGTTGPVALQVVHRMFSQGLLQYVAAAETYELAADLEGDLQTRALERANAQVSAADGVWQSAITLLDEKRTAAELPVSGLTVPTAGAMTAQPTPTPSIQTVPGGKNKGNRKKRRGGGG